MPVPAEPKIYHIAHVDRLASIVADGFLWSDAKMIERLGAGTTIGMSNIKARRLNELSLSCHPDLRVGHCTSFYFCSRSVLLYLIYIRNEELTCKGGQEPIVHQEADLNATIAWAEQNSQRWAFTLSNAGAFEDRSDLSKLGDKKRFSPRQIGIAFETLRTKGWLAAA
jgi:ssDNA thymidine ADP-ribosyltransferase, DarT